MLNNAYVKGFHDGAAHMYYDSAIKGMMEYGKKRFGDDKAAYDKWIHEVISDFERDAENPKKFVLPPIENIIEINKTFRFTIK